MLSNSLNRTEMDQELYLKFQELQDRIEELERDRDRLEEELHNRIGELEYEDNRQEGKIGDLESICERLGDKISDIG